MSNTFSLTEDTDAASIRSITFSNPPVNAMSPGLPGLIMKALEKIVDEGCRAVLLIPGGSGVLAGADITMQGKVWPEEEPLMSHMIAAIDACPIPVAILLRKSALGGGLEIALACRWRIAIPGTKLGQPEVNLGIPPGAGGTQRLPRVIGAEKALNLIVTGKPVSAEAALDIGLIDHLVPAEAAEISATDYLRQELEAGRVPPAVGGRRIEDAKPDVFEAAHTLATRRRRGETAPVEAIAAVEAAKDLPLEDGLAVERAAYLRCVVSPQAKAMRHMFFAERRALKGHVSGDITPNPVEQVGIVGAGTMGTGIALAFLMKGFQVHVAERIQDPLDAGLARIESTLRASVKKGRISTAQAEAMQDNLSSSLELSDLRHSDVVIEAAFEDMDVKQAVFAELADVAKPDAVLASNTSYLDLDKIATAARDRAEDVVGLHFFSPANIMPLLEIVRGAQTSEATLATALEVSRKLGKIGVVSEVCHGFIANRSFSAYLREAEFLLQEGATPEQVDAALVEFGMPMGPFAVRDLAGLDIGWAKRKSTAHLRNPDERYSDVGDLICERGWFGQKTGRGFYLYPDGARKGQPDPEVRALIDASAKAAGIAKREITDQEIIERCLYTVVNEGARIVEEGIARRASHVDVAWVNGYGFPRWRGGPMHWAEELGLSTVLARINDFDQANDFWTPAPLLVTLAEQNTSFAELGDL